MKGKRWNLEVNFCVISSRRRVLWQRRGEQHLSCPCHDVTSFKVFLFITHNYWNVFPYAMFVYWGVGWNAAFPEGQHSVLGHEVWWACMAVVCCHHLWPRKLWLTCFRHHHHQYHYHLPTSSLSTQAVSGSRGCIVTEYSCLLACCAV